jgi:pimeloyl-ACP methyl ester carboxylesterase
MQVRAFWRTIVERGGLQASAAIAGSDDNAVPMHHAKMLHDGIVGSRLVAIAGGDHALMWAQPDKWLEKVTEFLDS